MSEALPEGFVLEQESLPEGFVLEEDTLETTDLSAPSIASLFTSAVPSSTQVSLEEQEKPQDFFGKIFEDVETQRGTAFRRHKGPEQAKDIFSAQNRAIEERVSQPLFEPPDFVKQGLNNSLTGLSQQLVTGKAPFDLNEIGDINALEEVAATVVGLLMPADILATFAGGGISGLVARKIAIQATKKLVAGGLGKTAAKKLAERGLQIASSKGFIQASQAGGAFAGLTGGAEALSGGSAGEVLGAAGKGFATGAGVVTAAGPLGAILGKVAPKLIPKPVSQTLAEIASFGIVSPAMEGRIPEGKDFTHAAGVILGLRGVHGGSAQFQKARRNIAKRLEKATREGTEFKEAVETVEADLANTPAEFITAKKTPSTPEVAAEKFTIPARENQVAANPAADTFTARAKKSIRRNVLRAADFINELGPVGQRISSDINEIDFQVRVKTNNSTLDVLKAYKDKKGRMLPKEQIEQISQFADGYLTKLEVTQDIAERGNAVKKIMDGQRAEFESLGGQTGGLASGHSFSQVPNREGKKILKDAASGRQPKAKTINAAQKMVDRGMAPDIPTAIGIMAEYHGLQLRNVNPYFEGRRTPLPAELREWDPRSVLPSVIERNYMTIEGVRKWGWDAKGQSFPEMSGMLRSLKGQGFENDAVQIGDFVRASFGFGTKGDPVIQEISRKARAAQFVGKIAFSPLTITRNILDRFAKSYTTSPISINVKAVREFSPLINRWTEEGRRVTEQITRAGGVFGTGSIAEGVEPGSVIGRPFSLSEKGNQIHEGLVAKMRLDADIKAFLELQPESRMGGLLKAINELDVSVPKGPEFSNVSKLEQRLKSQGVSTDPAELVDILTKATSGGVMLPEQYQRVIFSAVRDQAFPVTLSTKRLWWDNSPVMRALSQFKVWPVEQTAFIYNDALKESLKGNPLPLVRFITATTLAGEAYNIARDSILGKEESLLTNILNREDVDAKDIGIMLAKDLIDGGGVGMFADMTWGITDWVMGPSIATLDDAKETIVTGGRELARLDKPGVQAAGQAIKSFGARQIPATRQFAGALAKADKAFGNEFNDTISYNKWKGRTFKFSLGQKELGDRAFETVSRTVQGPPQFPIGKDSFMLKTVAAQITLGDTKDAVDYLSGLLEGLQGKERTEMKTSIKASMRTRSPLGGIDKKDRGKFFNEFSDEDVDEVVDLNNAWLARYREALIAADERTQK